MRIINSVKFWLGVFTITLLPLFLLTGCSQKTGIGSPQGYVSLSEGYYRKAIGQYKKLISEGKDSAKLYFELGKVYYNHGEFAQAIEALRKSSQPDAQKFLAQALYRLGDLTASLEVFNRQKIIDDEYAYYHGLVCEGLNLFDQALGIYKGIQGRAFSPQAKARIEIIEKNFGLRRLEDLDPKIQKIISSAPGQEAYPQAGALILWADEQVVVTREDTSSADLHYIIKILNERGKDSFAEARIEYDSTYEKVELDYARTIKPDGSVANVGTRHIRDVSKYLNFPLYSNARIFIISFPEVAIGSCLEYKVKIKRSELINKKDFILDYPLQSEEPIIAADFTLTLPRDKGLKIKIINEKYNFSGANLNPAVEESGDSATYRWHFKDIPQIIPEPSMPPSVEINPTVLLSTFKDWKEVYHWWWGLAKDKIKADPEIKAKVRALIKAKGSSEDKARSIYNFCTQNIRYVAVEYGQAGYEPHSAADIFKNKYGDCKDQAILLVAMLREAGLEAYPLLIGTEKYYDLQPDFPAPLFNHCIAALKLNGKTIFLDPTAQTCSFGDLPAQDQERQVLVFNAQGYSIEKTPLYPAEHNFIRQELEIKVNNDESILVTKKNFTHGFFDQAQRYWLLYTQPELIQDVLDSAAQAVSIGAKVNKYNIENLNDLNKPVILSYSFHGNEYFTDAGRLRILPQLASVDTSLASKPVRKYPISLTLLSSKEEEAEIEIPRGFVVKNMPDNFSEDSPWLNLKVEYSFKNNQIFFRQKTQDKKKEVTQSEYADFKRFLEKAASSVKQRIVLERIEEKIKINLP